MKHSFRLLTRLCGGSIQLARAENRSPVQYPDDQTVNIFRIQSRKNAKRSRQQKMNVLYFFIQEAIPLRNVARRRYAFTDDHIPNSVREVSSTEMTDRSTGLGMPATLRR
jgi:hypothetical protein